MTTPDSIGHYFDTPGVSKYMVITKRFPTRYYTLQDFPIVMAVVVFVVLTIFMVMPHPSPGLSAELPRVWNPTPMPRFDRDNAMHLAIMRDGTMYFGADRVRVDELATTIRERLSQKDVEKKIYIKADMRTLTGNVNDAIDAIHDAGIENIAFMAEQRRPQSLEPRSPADMFEH